MRRFISCGAVLTVLSFPACAPAPAPEPVVDEAQLEAEAREGVRQTWARFIELWEAGDAAAAAALYTPDAVNMPAYGITQHGPAEMKAAFLEYHAVATIAVLSQETEEVFVHGDMAYERGTIVQELKPVEGESRTLPYRYMTVFQRQADGSWKFHRWLGQAGE